MKRDLFPVHQGSLRPQLLGTIATLITHVQHNALAVGGIHGDPDPLREVIRTGGNAFHHMVIFLVLVGATRWARLSEDHDCW
jgi:hypothetical protein